MDLFVRPLIESGREAQSETDLRDEAGHATLNNAAAAAATAVSPHFHLAIHPNSERRLHFPCTISFNTCVLRPRIRETLRTAGRD